MPLRQPCELRPRSARQRLRTLDEIAALLDAHPQHRYGSAIDLNLSNLL
jgi:hypothetical protein